MNAPPEADFHPGGDLAAVQVAALAAGTGDLARDMLAMLRANSGVRTLGEMRADLRRPVADIRATLAALEAVGLVHHRDLQTEDACELCWWAPRVPVSMPWNMEGRK